jgi:hypothetical protein
MRQEIIHYGILDNLWRFFPRKVTIKRFTPGTQDTYGEKTVGTWEVVTTYDSYGVQEYVLEDLQCAISPASGGEEKRANMTPVIYDHRIVISGYYEDIQENYRAVMDDGTEFDIVKKEHDSQQITTPLLVRLVVN